MRAYTLSCALTLSALTVALVPFSSASAASTHQSNYGQFKKQEVAARKQSSDSKPSQAVDQQPAVDCQTQTPKQDKMPEAKPTSSSQPANTAAHNPAGNNGFVKVNEEVVPDGIPQNDPHVSCTFNVEFYNYDANAGYYADVVFELQNPTAGAGYSIHVTGNTHPFIGADSAGGGNDLDARETYKLTFTGTPQANQGFHVKLTIHADGSKGADVKHKVFWVKPCEAPTSDSGHVLGDAASTTTPATPQTKSPAVLPAKLPSTGAMSSWLGLTATALASLLAYAFTYRFQRERA